MVFECTLCQHREKDLLWFYDHLRLHGIDQPARAFIESIRRG